MDIIELGRCLGLWVILVRILNQPQVVLERRTELLEDEDTRWRLEGAVERGKARERAQGQAFSRRMVNARLRKDEHLVLMHQQW